MTSMAEEFRAFAAKVAASRMEREEARLREESSDLSENRRSQLSLQATQILGRDWLPTMRAAAEAGVYQVIVTHDLGKSGAEKSFIYAELISQLRIHGFRTSLVRWVEANAWRYAFTVEW